MSMEYEVKVKGLADLAKFEASIKSLDNAMRMTKGAAQLNESLMQVDKSVRGIGASMARTIKSELELTRQVFRTELAGITAGTGKMVSASVATEFGEGVETGLRTATTRAKTAAAKAKAEMTKAYESIVGGDGLKALSNADLDEVRRLKQLGAEVSKFHTSLLSAKKSAREYASMFEGAYNTDLGRRQHRVQTFENSIIGLDKARVMKSAKESAETFSKAYTAELERNAVALSNFEKLVGIDKSYVAKSAKESAALFTSAYGTELAQSRQNLSNFEKMVGIDKSRLIKSAKDSAATFSDAYSNELARSKQVLSNFEKMVGIDKARIAKSAKDSAAAFSESYAIELARSKELFANFDKMLGLDKSQIVKSAKTSASTFAYAYEDELRKIRSSVGAATNASTDLYQKFTPKSGVAGAMVNMPKGTSPSDFADGKIPKATSDLARFTTQAGDAHAAVRGLASGFNLLWLTWGNLGPLMAGAALSNTFMKSAKEGMEVAHTLQTIASLGEVSAQGVAELNAELIRIGENSTYGPTKVAEAMQTLVLAGMKAKDVTTYMQDVLNFSKAGTTTVQNAADVLISVTTAFGTGAGGITRTSDLIVRAAADSKASVESFGEAMKTASVVGQQFGATQEDVASMITMLANLGITGTAAGTAIRNMYADLSGRTGKTAKLMRDAGIEFRDAATGGMRPLIETTRELNDHMNKLAATKGPKVAKDFMQALMSERGNKPMVAAILEFNTAAENSALYANRLEESLNRLKNAAGDTAVAAAAMGETTKSAWQRTGAALETTLLKAFTSMEPELYKSANAMRDLFNDPTVIAGVTTIANGVATVTLALAENAKIIGLGLAAWGGWKLATVAASAAAGVMTGNMASLAVSSAAAMLGIKGATEATEASARATMVKATADEVGAVAAKNNTVAAGGYATAAKGLVGVLGALGVIVGVAALAWDVYRIAKERAMGSTERDITRSNNVIEKMLMQSAELDKRTEKIKGGMDAGEAARTQANRTDLDNSMRELYESETKLSAELNNSLLKRKAIEEEIIKQRKSNPGLKDEDNKNIVYLKSQAKLTEAQDAATRKSLAQKKEDIRQQVLMFEYAENKLKTSAQGEQAASAEQQKKTEEERRRKQGPTLKNLGLNPEQLEKYFASGEMPEGTGPDTTGGRPGRPGRTPAAHQTYFDADYEVAKKLSEAQKSLRESDYQQGLVSVDSYYDYLDERAEKSYTLERKALEDKRAKIGSDPRSKKEYDKAGVELQVLDINRTVELRKLEQERSKAVADRLTTEGKIAVFGEDYLMRLRENDEGDIALKRGSEFARIEQSKARISEDFYKQRVRIGEEYVKESARLEGQGLADREEKYKQDLSKIRQYEADALEIVRVREEEKKAIRAEGLYGATRALENYMTSAADVASQVENVTGSALKGVEDALVQVATTGKISFKSLADSVISEFARMTARQATSGLAGFLGGALGSLFGGKATGAATGQGTMDSLTSMGVFAKGAAFSSSPSLSQYSNTVQSTPKLFAFAQGGVFGEAGPEAVMPLTRGADGNLGVRSHGGGAGGFILNIKNYGAEVEASEPYSDAEGNQVIDMIIKRATNNAVSTVAGQLAQGQGAVGKAMKARERMGTGA